MTVQQTEKLLTTEGRTAHDLRTKPRNSAKQHALNRHQGWDQEQTHSPFCVTLKNIPAVYLNATTHA